MVFVQKRIKPPSVSTVKSNINAVLNLKPAARAALVDITQLHGRSEGHPDLTSLVFSRVSQNAILRQEFKSMSERTQQAYLYRLAA